MAKAKAKAGFDFGVKAEAGVDIGVRVDFAKKGGEGSEVTYEVKYVAVVTLQFEAGPFKMSLRGEKADPCTGVNKVQGNVTLDVENTIEASMMVGNDVQPALIGRQGLTTTP